MILHVKEEELGPNFKKFHLSDEDSPWPFKPALHQFKEPDFSAPHDHPWDFRSYVLKGSYVEKVYYIQQDGSVKSELIHRKEGDSFYIYAEHIHQLVELPEGDCWTLVIAGPERREWKTYNFEE